MQLKTLCEDRVVLVDYDADDVRRIFVERNSWVLKRTHEWGADYGGSQVTDNSETDYLEIIPERILVDEDGCFCGAAILTEYDRYNGGGETLYQEVLLLTDGTVNDFAKDGYSFSNDDHDRWDYVIWQLVERPED